MRFSFADPGWRLSLCSELCTLAVVLCDLVENACKVCDRGLDASKQLSKKDFSGRDGSDNLDSLSAS